jgi:hypothetical protein
MKQETNNKIKRKSGKKVEIMEKFERMCKDDLRNVESNLRYYIKAAGIAADNALDNGNIAETDRLESLLDELYSVLAIVCSRIQVM